MTAHRAPLSRLRMHLALMRFGWVNGIVAALCVGAATAWAWGIPHLRSGIEMQRGAITDMRRSFQSETPAAPVPRPQAEEHLAAFYDTLGEKRYAEQQVKTLFAIAGKTKLQLNQAEYKLAFDKNGQYYTYQINLPVKGPYGDIRRFCEQTLLAIPFASLDEMNFKRDAIANRTLEAKLRITLYLADVPDDARKLMAGTTGMAE